MKIINKNRKFFNKIARYYDKGILGIWLNRVLKKISEEIKIKNNSKILDVGFGTGNFLQIISKNKTLKLEGIDISSKMREIAKNKLKNKAQLNLIPIEKIHYKNKFDYIFSTEAFHHYEDQNIAIKNMKRALKENGKLIIVDLDFGRILNWIFHIIEPGNSKMNSKKDFYNLFKKYGFKDIKQKKLGLFAIMNVGKIRNI